MVLAFLSACGPASCLCSVLLDLSFLFVWRCGVLCFVALSVARVARLSCLLMYWLCVGGSLFL